MNHHLVAARKVKTASNTLVNTPDTPFTPHHLHSSNFWKFLDFSRFCYGTIKFGFSSKSYAESYY